MFFAPVPLRLKLSGHLGVTQRAYFFGDTMCHAPVTMQTMFSFAMLVLVFIFGGFRGCIGAGLTASGLKHQPAGKKWDHKQACP
ncbi:MAG: hypothetical protein CMJ46_10925 [Planctomyces sp.]|nr:hypothetical protein [Planctomyces sp.]